MWDGRDCQEFSIPKMLPYWPLNYERIYFSPNSLPDSFIAASDAPEIPSTMMHDGQYLEQEYGKKPIIRIIRTSRKTVMPSGFVSYIIIYIEVCE